MLAGRALNLEVSDEADANGDEVELMVLNVPALELTRPAGTDFNLAVAGVDAVADDEMIGEAVLHAAFAVGATIGFRVAFFNGAVVRDDGFPVGAFDLDACGFGADGVEGVVVGGGLSWDDELLVDLDEVAAKVVVSFEGGDRCAVSLGDAAEGVAAFNGVDAGTGCECFTGKREAHRGSQEGMSSKRSAGK